MNIIPITDINCEELNIYSKLSESQLLHINEPDFGIFIAESPNVIMRALDAGYEPISILTDIDEIKGPALDIINRCPNATIYAATHDVLINITGFQMHRGLLCAMRRRELASPLKLCQDARRIAVLEGVVNPTNIGAIMRSAAALNVDAILLSPDCSDPLYRRAARVSMGTVFQIPWTYVCSTRKEWDEKGMQIIKDMGYQTVALALKDNSIPISDSRLADSSKLAIFLGAEGDGLSDATINACDYTAIIPMTHGVDSLNVAAASAVAFWQLCN